MSEYWNTRKLSFVYSIIGMNELQLEEFIQVKFLKTFYIKNIHDWSYEKLQLHSLIVNLQNHIHPTST